MFGQWESLGQEPNPHMPTGPGSWSVTATIPPEDLAASQASASASAQPAQSEYCGTLAPADCHACCNNLPWYVAWIPGYKLGCDNSCSDTAIGSRLPNSPWDVLPSVNIPSPSDALNVLPDWWPIAAVAVLFFLSRR